VKDKKIHHGANLLAGEFGLLMMNYDFDTENFEIFSERGATASLVNRVARYKGISKEGLTGKKIYQDAEAGDSDCMRAIKEFYEALAVGIYGLTYAFNPECIVLGGAISAREDIVECIREKLEIIKRNVKADVATMNPPILRASCAGDANMIGAVYNFMLHTN